MGELEQEQAVEPAEETPVASVGTLLREAREASDINIADAARQLKWGVRQLEALEADDYSKLPGPTFVRGFIRNYAKLLHADPQPMLDAYQRTGPQTPTQVIASQDGQVSFTEHPKSFQLRYGLVLVVVLAVAGYALYEWSPLSASKQAAPVGEATTLPQPEKSAPVPLPQPEAVKPAEPAPSPVTKPAPLPPVAPVSAAPPAATVSVAPQAVSTPIPQPDNKNLPSLNLAFSGDSWVEVRDRSGKIVFSQLSHANTQQIVQGLPPFELVIGNAPAVKLSYKGKPVDLTAFTRAEVARIKLD